MIASVEFDPAGSLEVQTINPSARESASSSPVNTRCAGRSGMEPARLAGTVASPVGVDGLGVAPVEPLVAEAMTTRTVTAIREMPGIGRCTSCSTIHLTISLHIRFVATEPTYRSMARRVSFRLPRDNPLAT